MRAIFLLLLGAACVSRAADNQLTPEEKRAGWKLLFDGRTLRNWLDPAKGNIPGNAWAIENGAVKTVPDPIVREDLLTRELFTDFELVFDWKVAQAGNTGVKYRIQDTIFIDETQHPPKSRFEDMVGREYRERSSNRAKLKPGSPNQVYVVGYEMQLLDDERHPDAKRDRRHVTGALYSMIEPARRDAAKPAGEWNTGRIVVRGQQFEHWINGIKVNEGSLDAEPVRAGVAKRWQPAPPVRDMLSNPKPAGRLALQHHQDEAWFKNIKVRKLKPGAK
ncbi:MAG: DUF1080 domain-containing protein [Acidobacteria bacterium]|nr:DUF1080 domain-containing protein [Acidobacteriota bacterium]